MAFGAELIAAGAALVGTAAQVGATSKLNKKNRQWQEDMWNKTNEYNTPANQMQRFKDAGLNPNLIYGKADYNASMPSAPQQSVPEYSKFGEVAMQYIMAKQQQTKIKLDEQAIKVAEAEEKLKNASVLNVLANTTKVDTENQFLKDTYQDALAKFALGVETSRLGNDKIQKEIDSIGEVIKNSQKGRELTDAQINKIQQDIAESQERMKGYVFDRNLKAVQSELENIKKKVYENGGNPNDPVLYRRLDSIIESTGAYDLLKEAGQGVNNFSNWLSDKFRKGFEKVHKK